MPYKIAIIGATGAVGRKIIEGLETRRFPVSELKLFSSERSAGCELLFKGEKIKVEKLTKNSFSGVDIAFFSAGSAVSREFVKSAVLQDAVVIDNTSAFRMSEDVPLVVPEVNGRDAFLHKGVIANPNCSTIQMVVALKPIYDNFGISKIVVTTFQAVSGAGNMALNALVNQTKAALKGIEFVPDVLPVRNEKKYHPIAFNVIPQIDKGLENGFTFEEMKMIDETRKILKDEELAITATCVRVPVMFGHSEAVYVELKKEFKVEDLKEVLSKAKGVRVEDNILEQEYPMPFFVANKEEVFVGRIRKDLFNDYAVKMWVVADNLLKGAATNAIQIAEILITKT